MVLATEFTLLLSLLSVNNLNRWFSYSEVISKGFQMYSCDLSAAYQA